MMISMQKASTPANLVVPSWETAIAGPVVDDRGKAAVAFVRANAATVMCADWT
jgi:hypothetical protein